MENLFNLSAELADGTPVTHSDLSKGNCFVASKLPRKGEELNVEGKRYIVEQVIHEFHPEFTQQFCVRLSEI